MAAPAVRPGLDWSRQRTGISKQGERRNWSNQVVRQLACMVSEQKKEGGAAALPQAHAKSMRPLAQNGRPEMTTFERVGFIGLGGMGRGLVKNLVAKGAAVTAYDLNPAAVAVAKSLGATVAAGVQEIRDTCRIVMICVNEAEDVEALMIARDGLLAGAAPGFIIVDHTTGSPQMVAKLDRMVREAGGRYAEAPMTRTPT